ncbi:MAG: 2-oxo acid dehydrogenase subunit E2, partial [Proteobacteria bacterium]|nr:2-oxo acid dehydrogenase subunit E2 [Pseudomonadota bacterium]
TIIVAEGETVEVGTVIALVDSDITSSALPVPAKAQTKAPQAPPMPVALPGPARQEPAEAGPEGTRFYSPLVLSIATKEGVGMAELESIPGSGTNGRLRKTDLFAYLKTRRSGPAPSAAPHADFEMQAVDMAEMLKKYPAGRYQVRQMDNVQKKMAEHMVKSVHTSPHVGAISECDLSRIVSFRIKAAASFEKEQGFKLTYTPFFFDATVRALKEFPLINSSIEGDKVIVKNFINLGMAVASPTGLIVPVIKSAEEKNFLGLARAINDIALRTRNKKLMPDEIMGGTFSISNYGVFGNIIGTPIISQPQVAILGIGAITKRPVVVTDQEGNDSIAIRSICYLTLSFDHRIIDGALGGQFLEAIVKNLEEFEFEGVA